MSSGSSGYTSVKGRERKEERNHNFIVVAQENNTIKQYAYFRSKSEMLSTRFWLYCTISEKSRAKLLKETSAFATPAGLFKGRSRIPKSFGCVVEEALLADAIVVD